MVVKVWSCILCFYVWELELMMKSSASFVKEKQVEEIEESTQIWVCVFASQILSKIAKIK